MNTTLSNSTVSAPSRHDEQLHHEQPILPTRRVGMLDRAALHLGVALIKWGRRPQPGRERRVNRAELALLRGARDARVAHHRERVAQDYALMLRLR